MRTPVVSTTELSRNDIYDMKHEFDAFLESEFKKAVNESTKSDILQGLTHEGQLISINPTWEKLYREKPHIEVFLEHLSEKEQVFNKNYYIIRTFEDIRIENDRLISDVGIFTGLDREVLLHATGIISAEQMANQFRVELEEIEKVYYRLNDKCLVYMGEF